MIHHLSITDAIWLAIGFGGQGIFSARFLLQWIHSERQRRSVIPVAFWYLSLIGAVTVLAYAIHIHDPVFIAAQLFGIVVYSRNLYFIYKLRQTS